GGHPPLRGWGPPPSVDVGPHVPVWTGEGASARRKAGTSVTEHGGGRDSDRNSADSWFRPSQNRHRTQSEYQDPLDEQREEEGQGTVFPDSGGYAGSDSARPGMVEPYP